VGETGREGESVGRPKNDGQAGEGISAGVTVHQESKDQLGHRGAVQL